METFIRNIWNHTKAVEFLILWCIFKASDHFDLSSLTKTLFSLEVSLLMYQACRGDLSSPCRRNCWVRRDSRAGTSCTTCCSRSCSCARPTPTSTASWCSSTAQTDAWRMRPGTVCLWKDLECWDTAWTGTPPPSTPRLAACFCRLANSFLAARISDLMVELRITLSVSRIRFCSSL